jgi:hypothetical protein
VPYCRVLCFPATLRQNASVVPPHCLPQLASHPLAPALQPLVRHLQQLPSSLTLTQLLCESARPPSVWQLLLPTLATVGAPECVSTYASRTLAACVMFVLLQSCDAAVACASARMLLYTLALLCLVRRLRSTSVFSLLMCGAPSECASLYLLSPHICRWPRRHLPCPPTHWHPPFVSLYSSLPTLCRLGLVTATPCATAAPKNVAPCSCVSPTHINHRCRTSSVFPRHFVWCLMFAVRRSRRLMFRGALGRSLRLVHHMTR